MYQVQAMQIIAQGYANYDIWGRWIKKFIAWGMLDVYPHRKLKVDLTK